MTFTITLKGGTEYPEFCLMALFWSGAGIFVGSSAWDNWESKYQNALREARKRRLMAKPYLNLSNNSHYCGLRTKAPPEFL